MDEIGRRHHQVGHAYLLKLQLPMTALMIFLAIYIETPETKLSIDSTSEKAQQGLGVFIENGMLKFSLSSKHLGSSVHHNIYCKW